MPVLKLTKYLPMDPFTRMRNVSNLYREYGKQILREQGPDVDAERKANSKDVMSILSKFFHSPRPNSILEGGTVPPGARRAALSHSI